MSIDFPLLIDGGLSNVLEDMGCDLNQKLWSAKILETNPEAIIQAHLTYLESGARCITTSSYQATVKGFMEEGHSRESAAALISKTVSLAEEAVKRFQAQGNLDYKPLIAASIGPYGAYLADGSEYTGNYGIPYEDLKAFHLERIRILERSNADFFACETIPSLQEAEVLAEILHSTGKSAWVTFSCKDQGHIHDGTEIGKCLSLFADHPKVFALGVNCTAPKYISGLIRTLKKGIGEKKIIVYPNSGQVYDAKSKTWLGLADPISFSGMTREWIGLGADIVGGCCRTGPEHIRSISQSLSGSK